MESVREQAKSLQPSLVARAVAGDREAFRGLVEPHLSTALGAATALLRSPSEADDAVQDALLSAWLGLHQLRRADAFPAWFRRHVIRSAMKRLGQRPRVTELDLTAMAPVDDLEQALERRALGRAFGRLETKDRLILTLHHFWSLPVAETAGLLGVPEGTVKSRAHQARARLRAAYAAEERG